MKTVLFCISVGFIFFSLKGYSQIKVYEDNRVKIFGDRPTDDANKDLSMQIYGPYGQYLANGKLGFGDYPIEPNLFIGEYGEDIDSDKLELHGDDGIYLTWGKGYDFNNIIAHINYIPYLVENPFYFNTDVYATGILLTSDKGYKENIIPIGNSLSRLKQINGVNYNLKHEENKFAENISLGKATDKEQRDIASYNNVISKLNEDQKERMGFIAQKVQTEFPELVSEDEEGYLSIDYIGIIPVLVEAMKEQQKQISLLESFYNETNPIK